MSGVLSSESSSSACSPEKIVVFTAIRIPRRRAKRHVFLVEMSRAITIVFLLFLAQPASAADKWLRIHSKNFLLVGNAGESDIRRVGRSLEEFRTAVGIMFPKMDQTPTAPLTVLVFKNEESFKPYKPLNEGNPANVVAFFQPGEDVNYIAVPATPVLSGVVLHEYLHLLVRENVGNLPLWISEGLGECYSTFEIGGKQNEFTIGRPPEQHIATLIQGAPFVP